ncbi:MAG: arginine--tRNA ligase [Candidatus Peregrinibacteria bacterium]
MKKTNLAQVREMVLKAVQAAGFEIAEADIHLQSTPTLAQGHLACNLAMLIAHQLGKKPMEVAQVIVEHLRDPLILKAEAAHPGFINLFLEQKFYTSECLELVVNPGIYLKNALGLTAKTMVIEYSSPNIAKPLGVHHLLSTVIGESLKRIHKAYGHKVIAENYPGDIGTQFGKLMHAIKVWGDEKTIEKDPINELLKLYVKFHEEAEKDPSLEDHGRAEYKKFEEGDKEARRMWKKIVDWSFKEIQPLYDRLGVAYDGVHGESFFEERMKDILKEGREKGVFVDGEKGSWIVLPDNPEDTPALVKKSDGTTLYLTRDLAQMDFLEKEYHPNVIVWVVDVAQSFYFQQRFHAYKKLRNTVTQFVHVAFGRMAFEGRGASTRKGNIVRLSELLDEAEVRALALARNKAEGLSEAELKELARVMGIGSVKYNILSQNRIQNITFDWDKMLSFDGNSAPYLMYTATRIKSILRKGGFSVSDAKQWELNFTSDLETKVATDLLMYPVTLERAATEYKPNHIANCLYSLAQDFNTLYNALPVLKAESKSVKNTRLLLTIAVLKVMEHGLGLLSIEVPEKM